MHLGSNDVFLKFKSEFTFGPLTVPNSVSYGFNCPCLEIGKTKKIKF